MPPEIIPAEKATIIGGPEATVGTAGAAATAAAAEAAGGERKPIFEGIGGKFDTPEELSEYTKNLEAQLITEKARPKTSTTNQAIPTAAQPSKDPEEAFYEGVENELFTSPKETIKKIVDHTRNQVRAENQREAQTKSFWDGFYSENPDLRPLESVVKSIVAEKNSEIAPLKLSDAKAFIAKEARKVISAVRAQAGIQETELPEGGATVLSSSAGGSGIRPAATGERQVSFIDQVREMKARRSGAK